MKIAELEAQWFVRGHRFVHLCAREVDRKAAMARFFIEAKKISTFGFIMERQFRDWNFIVASPTGRGTGHAPYVVLEDTHRWDDSERFPRARLLEEVDYIAAPMQGLPGTTIRVYSGDQ